jgi:hypothetical protein
LGRGGASQKTAIDPRVASLQLSPRSFLVGRECQIKPVHGLGNLTSLRAHSTDYQTKLV